MFQGTNLSNNFANFYQNCNVHSTEEHGHAHQLGELELEHLTISLLLLLLTSPKVGAL